MSQEQTHHTKPPTQIAGVHGFDAFAAQPDTPAPPREPIDWGRLFALPPFQMFMMEVYRHDAKWVTNPLNYADMYTLDELNGLAREYVKWHAEKGLWPRENAWGELLEREP